ncbi:SpoIIE family protein phosphatase [Streptomyces sp. NPDC002004]
MKVRGTFTVGGENPDSRPSQASGLMDLLGVAAVVVDAEGRIVLWSPQAHDLFGYPPEEALGAYAARLLVDEDHLGPVIELFGEVMATGRSWAGAFPIRHKDGGTRLVEFRNMRLEDDLGDLYALGLATDQETLSRVERDVALSTSLIAQSPIGVKILDKNLRYVSVNPALERINGITAADHVGHTLGELLPDLQVERLEGAMRRVLATGIPVVDRYTTGRTPADPDHDHSWSVSFYRLEDSKGRILGVAGSVVDVTDRHQAFTEAAQARRRLAIIADASARVGTTLEVEQTAHELAGVTVPELADVVAVDVLDSVLGERRPSQDGDEAVFRALAVKSAYPTDAVVAADPPGRIAGYASDRVVTHCVRTGRPQLIPYVDDEALLRIARDGEAASVLADAGVHSYLAVPLIARGAVLGAMSMIRARNPVPFDEDDMTLAGELASRAAVCIDNARWYQSVRNTATTLQRSLLPEHPAHHPGLQIASRYRPAQATSEVGGDWYDVIPLSGDRTALVVGDVMGSGIDAAATMGRLRTATSTLADLDLDPGQVLQHLDRITTGLEHYIATCVYAVYDPRRGVCEIATAGHLPPVLVRKGGAPELLALPLGAPLGVGEVGQVPFETTAFDLTPGDRLVLYTDGLVETRHEPIDERLDALLQQLDGPALPLEETCDQLINSLRQPDEHDDVALLMACVQPTPLEEPEASEASQVSDA